MRMLVVLGVFLMAAITVPAGAETVDKQFHESFDAPEGTILAMEYGDGDVEVVPWDRATIDVVVKYRGEVKTIGIGQTQGFDVEFRRDGNTVHVVGREKGGATFGIRYKQLEEYTYTVHAPAHVILDLDGDDGDVVLEGWRAEIDCKLDDGELHFKDVQASAVTIHAEDGDTYLTDVEGNLFFTGDDGDVVVTDSNLRKGNFRLEDGDLTLKQCRGDFDVAVDDGDIRFNRVSVGTGSVHTEDGDVDLELVAGLELDLDIETGDGAVSVDFEEGMSVAFSVLSDDGTISLDLSPGSKVSRDGHRVSGELGEGRGRLRIKTDDGDVALRELSAAP